MPMLDMPLEQLRSYTGTNPCPADHAAYWQRALARLAAQPDELTLRPAAFSAPGFRCEDLYFTGVGGARIHCRLVRRQDLAAPAPALLLFHGYGGYTGPWTEKLAYAALGFVVCAMDARGQGGASQDVGGVLGTTQSGLIMRGMDDPDNDRLYFRNVYLDTAQAARIVMGLPGVDASRVSAMGGSQGGALTMACAALTPALYKAVPSFPFLCDFKRVWDMDLAINAYADIRDYFRHFDATHSREQAVFEKLGYIDLIHLAPRVRASVQLHTCLMDDICPPSTQFALYNRLTCPKQMILYPDFGHEGPPEAADTMTRFLLE